MSRQVPGAGQWRVMHSAAAHNRCSASVLMQSQLCQCTRIPHAPRLAPQVAALLEAEYSPEEVASVPLMPPQELGGLLDGMC